MLVAFGQQNNHHRNLFPCSSPSIQQTQKVCRYLQVHDLLKTGTKKQCALHFVMMQLLPVEMQRRIINTTWWLFTLPKWGWKYSKVILHDQVRVASLRDCNNCTVLHLHTIHNGSAGLKQLHKSKWHYHLWHENGNTDQADDNTFPCMHLTTAAQSIKNDFFNLSKLFLCLDECIFGAPPLPT